MAGDTVITVVGNLTADPELRTTGSGSTLASFTIASTPRSFNRNTNQWEDGQALFLRCTAWRDLAEHCAKSLSKGMRVIAQGRLQQRSYQAQDGSNRSVIEMQIDEIGPSLRYATADVHRQSSSGGFQGRNSGGFQGGNAGNGGYSGGGYAGNSGNGGYSGGSSYSGGSNYSGGNQGGFSNNGGQSAPAADPWSSQDTGSTGSFGTFGATEFGGGDEPEF
ncbi:single-stranded DNA-binding protein [Bifidobacterium choloepi]|uniref:Single-stranded DNA-binding protein n=1 Tax=Bifidobacterium choloepi TaxID=2614131 RepID=A0A6I5NCK9_9BIFI|nr:single-stranded DNA-binding protein [Bifidobacterium choloepi]NEG70270.1 single-stranded DNA-binding protein [Bifidobacterium choloepi]